MDKRVYFLMIVSFVIGMVELIISGLLDLIAEDMNVTLGQAGFLITIFSLIFAIASPILLFLTSNIERKRLTLISLCIFLIGNIVTLFSPTYSILFLGRVISATSGALLIILCLVMAPTLVRPQYRGRAIGIVSMGVSGSLVLGVPIGLVLGNTFGWRAPFLMITILTILSIIGVYYLMDRVAPKPAIGLKEQLQTLKQKKILFAQTTTFLYMTGHTVLYAYLVPFLNETMGIQGTLVSIVFFVFGVAAVSGGGIGGTLADLYGSRRTAVIGIILFVITVFSIPYTTFALPVFLGGVIIWGILSWAITPAVQSYLIQKSPQNADIQQSLNNSALHFGIAFGSFIGGIIIERTTVEDNAMVGSLFILLSLGTAFAAFISKSRTKAQVP
ncbi:MFS transporter [Oceanobacillus halotolerans]|uniref:MFS transporter n=1 Tax=Oceanobacillus halotolerans TaxID=2663380 RepID=UPI0013DA8EDE|nr:MFS transporter [Oceanobacillus halotolerans]